jgi:hypothetical protein
MAAPTVEAKYRQAIEHAYISTWMLYEGTEPAIEERIDWAIERLEEARDYHRKVVKKQARLSPEQVVEHAIKTVRAR